MLNGVNTQVMQAQIPYTGAVALAHDVGDGSVPALSLPERIPNTIAGLSGSNRNVGGSRDVSAPMMGVDPRGAWMNLPLYRGNTVPGERVDTGSIPTRNRMNITISSLRLRGARSPSQAYDGDARRLYCRLIREGADAIATGILCDIIFAGGVTVEALMAPIQTWEMFLAYGGATKMWQLLLETEEVTPGGKKYCCLLCPVGNRKEYKHNRDAVRHFNKDHVGFAFPCEYW
jgi:hypothetical protein